MITPIRVLALAAVIGLSVGLGVAFANNGLGKPPLANATLVVSPITTVKGAASLTFTFTLGSAPGSIANGMVDVEAPAGWTFTAASINGSSTCTPTGSVGSLPAAEVEVSGLFCTNGQTLILDVTATTPVVTEATLYSFEGSFKAWPGSRRVLVNGHHNLWLTNEPTVTVTAT